MLLISSNTSKTFKDLSPSDLNKILDAALFDGCRPGHVSFTRMNSENRKKIIFKFSYKGEKCEAALSSGFVLWLERRVDDFYTDFVPADNAAEIILAAIGMGYDVLNTNNDAKKVQHILEKPESHTL